MTRQELNKNVSSFQDQLECLRKTLQLVIWGNINEKPELFDSLSKGEQILLINMLDEASTLERTIFAYNSHTLLSW